jgi:hypothetical protein
VGNGDVDRYRWLEAREDALVALAVTLVSPASDSHVGALRPTWTSPTALTWRQALGVWYEAFQRGELIIQPDLIDGWTALLEPNGGAASMPEALARLSAEGVAVSVSWNVNAVMSARVARRGVVVADFDPLLYDDDARTPTPEEAGLPFGDPNAPLRAAAFAFLTRVTGVVIEREWLLERARPAVSVPIPRA